MNIKHEHGLYDYRRVTRVRNRTSRHPLGELVLTTISNHCAWLRHDDVRELGVIAAIDLEKRRQWENFRHRRDDFEPDDAATRRETVTKRHY